MLKKSLIRPYYTWYDTHWFSITMKLWEPAASHRKRCSFSNLQAACPLYHDPDESLHIHGSSSCCTCRIESFTFTVSTWKWPCQWPCGMLPTLAPGAQLKGHHRLNAEPAGLVCKHVPTAKANGQGLVPSTYNIQSLRMQQGSCGVFSSDKIHSAFMQLSTLSLQALPSLSAATSFRSIAAQVPAHTGLPSSMIEGNLNKMRISYSWEAISDATNWCRARKSKLIQTDTFSGGVVIQCHLIFKVTCLPWMVFGCAARPEGLRSAKC